jgi:ABC-type sugar transport system ATPase subunit
VREALGAETLVHFRLRASHVDSGDPDALDELDQSDETRCTARFSPATRVHEGDTFEVNVATSKLHFFDRTSHLAIRD